MKFASVFSGTIARGSRLRIGKKAALLALLVVLLAGVLAGGALAEETQRNQTALLTDDATLFEGHLYRALDVSLSWEDARTFCENLGGHLVTITSTEEQALVESLLGSGEKNCYWIGAKCSYNSYSWVTGEAFAFVREDELVNGGGQNSYLYMDAAREEAHTAGQWGAMASVTAGEDYYALDALGLVCEWDAETVEETYTYTIENATYCTITGYTGPNRTLTLPAELGGYSVLKIAPKAFEGNVAITSVVIPEGIETIDYDAFGGCSSLEKAVLPTTLSTLSSYAFRNCTALADVNYPVGWTSVAGTSYPSIYSPFVGCTSLVRMAIPEGVTSVPDYAFADASGLCAVTLPSTLKTIGRNSFSGTSLNELKLPASLQTMGNYAFSDIGTLRSVTFGEGIQTIAPYAFKGCSTLELVSLPESLLTIEKSAFYACTALSGIVIPNSVCQINEGAFANCTSLSEINYPTSWTSSNGAPFEGCSALKTIDVPEGITALVKYAFKGSGVEQVSLPSTLTTISDYSFQNCAALRGISLPEGLESIGMYAFYGSGLHTIRIPAKVLTIGNWAFAYSRLLREAVVSEGVTSLSDSLFAYCAGLTDVTLPDTLTQIGTSAFTSCTSLQSLVLPDSVTAIRGSAFSACTSLSKVNFPRAWNSADPSVFSGCTSLRNLVVPEGVTAIPNYAFYGSALHTVILPDSLESIGREAFRSCADLQRIRMGANLSAVGTNAFYDVPSSLEIYGAQGSFAQTFAQENGFTFIAEELELSYAPIALRVMCGETPVSGVRVTIYNVTDDSRQASMETDENGEICYEEGLAGYTYRVDVYHGGYTMQESSYAFTLTADGCDLGDIAATALIVEDETPAKRFIYHVLDNTYCEITDFIGEETVVIIPETLDGYVVKQIASTTFRSEIYIETVILPETVEVIGREAFSGCTSLKTVRFGKNLTQIDESAFADCKSLEQVELPPSVSTLSRGAFANCTALSQVNYPVGWKTTGGTGTPFSGCTALTSIVIPEGVTTIPDYAFSSASNLSSVTLPDTLQSIGNSAFSYTALTEVHFPAALRKLGSSACYYVSTLRRVQFEEGLTSIAGSTFEDCTALEDVTLPPTLQIIDVSAFSKCTALERIVLPDSITKLGNSAFGNCTALREVNFPRGWTTSGIAPFSGCSALTAMVVPEGVTAIPSSAFRDSGLAQITLPSTLTAIGEDSFRGCANMNAIALPESLTSIGQYAFASSGLNAITLPANVQTIGRYAFSNCKLLKNAAVNEGVTRIEGGTFDGCTSLKEIALPGSLREIGIHAFRQCTALRRIEIPDGVTTLDSYAFDDCTSLSEVRLPIAWTKVSYSNSTPFTGCTSLKNIVVPEGMTQLPDYAFSGMSALSTVILPDSLESIGKNAFYNCTGLTRVRIWENVSAIDSSAFSNVPQTLEMYGVEGSYAQTFAAEKGFVFIAEDLQLEFAPVQLRVMCGETPVSGVQMLLYNMTDEFLQLEMETDENGEIYYAEGLVGCTYRMDLYHRAYTTERSTLSFTLTADGYEVAIEAAAIDFAPTAPEEDFTYRTLDNASCEITGYTGEAAALVLPDTLGGYSVRQIGSNAFRNNAVLESVVLPDTVEGIGTYAFQNCTALTSVRFGKNLTKMDSYAFSGCSALERVQLPASVTTLASYAFYNCTALSDVNYPVGWVSVSGYYTPFAGCTSLESMVIPEGVMAVPAYAFAGAKGLTSVSLPGTLREIGERAFSDASLTEVDFPASLQTLSYSAFYNNDALQRIHFEDGLTVIKGSAFDNCDVLTQIDLPKTLTTLESYAFSNCKALTSVVLPDSVQEINTKAFAYCVRLTSINFPLGWTKSSGAPFYGCTALTSMVVPEGVTRIPDYAFQDSSLTNVTLPQSLTEIGKCSFRICAGLKSITLPEGLVSIGESAFSSSGLTSVQLPAHVRTVEKYAFSSCAQLENAVVNEGLTTIPYAMFQSCSSLKDVSLPSTLKCIAEYAFNNCTALESVVLPDGIEEMNEYAFGNCSSLREINFPLSWAKSNYASPFVGCPMLMDMIVPEGVAAIPDNAFDYMKSLSSITLPSTLQTIGSEAFAYTALREMTLPDGLTGIGSNAFRYNQTLERITIPDGVTTIQSSTFDHCTSLREVKLPAALTSIGYSAFYECDALTEIALPDTITQISNQAFCRCDVLEKVNYPLALASTGNANPFQSCPKLTAMVVPEGVTAIPNYMFDGSALTSISLPSTLKSIGTYAFRSCKGLTSVELPQGLTSIGTYAFADCIMVSRFEIPDGITQIPGGAFSGCTGMSSVSLPAGLTKIGDYAFNHCSALQRVQIPDTVTSLGSNAFGNCTHLEYANYPANLTSSGSNGPFNGCIALRSMTVPYGVTQLRGNTFSHMDGLTSVTLPSTLRSIDERAFYSCDNLSTISFPANLTAVGNYAFAYSGLTSVTFPAHLSTIGREAFSDCKKLQDVTLNAALSKIDYSAFASCDRLVSIKAVGNCSPAINGMPFTVLSETRFYAMPGSGFAQYLTNQGYDYTPYMEGSATVVVSFDEVVDLAEYEGFILQLAGVSNGHGTNIVIKPDQYSYTFYGLVPGDSYHVQLLNEYQQQVAVYPQFVAVEGENPLRFALDVNLQDITVRIFGSDGAEIVDDCEVVWLNADDKQIAIGDQLKNMPEGTVLKLKFKMDEYLLTQYYQPAAMRYEVKAENNVIDLYLDAITMSAVSGTVYDAQSGEPLSGVHVGVLQRFTSQLSSLFTTFTDENGAFTLYVYDVDADIRFLMDGYKSDECDLNAFRDAGSSVALRKIKGITLPVSVRFVPAGENQETQTWDAEQIAQSVVFKAYNETQQCESDDFVFSDGSLIFMSAFSAGERVRMRASSTDHRFAPVETTLVLESDAPAVFELVQYGGIALTAGVSPNAADVAILFDAEDEFVAQKTLTGGTATFSELQAGEYVLAVLGQTPRFANVARLSDLNAMGFAVDTDYLLVNASVSDGEITACAVSAVPSLDQSKFSFIDVSRTQYALNRSAVTLGSFTAIRMQGTLADGALSTLENPRWEFVLPKNCHYYDQSLTIDSVRAECTYDGSSIFIPAESASQLMRFCILSDTVGTYSINAYLSYVDGGVSYREPAGYVTFETTDMEMSLPRKTGRSYTYVKGRTYAGSTVYLYDGNVNIGQTQALADGSWGMFVELYHPMTLSHHRIRAKVVTPGGLTLLSGEHLLEYNAMATPVRSITLIAAASSARIDYSNPESSRAFYTYNGENSFTFVVEFESDVVVEDIKELYVIAIDASGVKTYIPITYNTATMQWTGSYTLTGQGIPEAISVSCSYRTSDFYDQFVSGYTELDAQYVPTQQSPNHYVWNDIANGFELTVEVTKLESFDSYAPSVMEAQGYISLGTRDGFTSYSKPDTIETIDLFEQEDQKYAVQAKMAPVTPEAKEKCEQMREQFPGLSMGAPSSPDATDTPSSSGGPSATPAPKPVVCRDSMSNKERLSIIYSMIPHLPGDNYHVAQLADDARRYSIVGLGYGGAGLVMDSVNVVTSASKSPNGIVQAAEGISAWKDYMDNHQDRINALIDILTGIDARLRLAENDLKQLGLIDIKEKCDDPNEENEDFSQPVEPIIVSHDPSGVIYEAVLSNRVQGATVTVYQHAPKEDMYGDIYYEPEVWEAARFDQVNPQFTLADGAYGWDVPEGYWQVKAEKEGYETAYSEWLPVPPIQTNVNLALISYYQPTVERISYFDDYVEIQFSKYMRTDTLTTGNITVSSGEACIEGEIMLVDEEESPTEEGVTYTSRIRFYPTEAFAQEQVNVRISTDVKSYASVAFAQAYESTGTLRSRPDEMSMTAQLTMNVSQEGTVEISASPAAAAAGETVRLTAPSSLIELSATAIVLDENGRGSFTVKALLPGECEVTARMPSSDLSCKTAIAINSNQAKKPSASVEDGAVIAYGTVITLIPAGEEETLYYTMDGSCPKVSDTRIAYTEPFAITEGNVIRVCAVREGYLTSAVLSIHYTLIPEGGLFLSTDTLYLKTGEGISIPVLTAAGAAFDGTVVWTSSDASRVIAGTDGSILRLAEGEATISAALTDGTLIAQCIVYDDTLERMAPPASLKQLEAEAMLGDTALQCIDFSGNAVLNVGSAAFKDCTQIRKVILSQGCVLASDAFEGCEQVVVHCPTQEQALWAQQNGLKFVLIVQ